MRTPPVGVRLRDRIGVDDDEPGGRLGLLDEVLAPIGTKSPITWSRTTVQACSRANRARPSLSSACIEPALELRTPRSAARRSQTAPVGCPAHPVASSANALLERSTAGARDEGDDGDRSQTVNEPVEEEEE